MEKNYNGVAIRRLKKVEDTFTRFDTIHERDGHQTDGRTDIHRTTAQAALMQASRGKTLAASVNTDDAISYAVGDVTVYCGRE